ncbi:potassium channel protein [Methanolobus psychrophilus R15]|nr:potassium channel protein [Methanolobus psychrophilus R15]
MQKKLWYRTILRSFLLTLSVVLVYLLIFIHIMEYEQQYDHANMVDGAYWTISTITTVGYGDIIFASAAGKFFSILVQLSGIPIVFGFLFSLIISPWLEKNIRPSLPVKSPRNFSGHIIICGYNSLIETLVEELNENKIPYVLIEEEDSTVEDLLKKNVNVVQGNLSDETTFRNVHIEKASSVIVNRSDEVNANIILTVRTISDINIIAIAEDRANKKYMKYAGATSVISPKELFGRFIARKAADPFLRRLTGATEFFDGVSIVEFPIYPKSPLLGKSIKVASIHEKTGANLVGMWKGGVLSFDIDPHDIIKDNSVLLAVGTTDQLSELRKLTQQTR